MFKIMQLTMATIGIIAILYGLVWVGNWLMEFCEFACAVGKYGY